MPDFNLPALLMPLILVAGLAQGTFLTVVLLAVRHSYRPGREMLAGLLAALTLSILCQFLSETGLYTAMLPLYLVVSGMTFLIGPFLYLSLVRFTGTLSRRREGVHFVPFVVNFVFLLAFWIADEPELRRQLAEQLPQTSPGWYPLVKTMALVTYGVLSLVRLNQSVAHLREQRSSFAKINLLWLENLIGGYLLLLALLLVLQLFPQLGQVSSVSADAVMVLFMVGGIYGMGYFWMKYPILLAPEEVLVLAEPVWYKDSSLRPDQAEAYRQKLLEGLTRDEPYLDPELTLAQLATQLGMPSHHLSQVINEQLGLNFFELINRCRIDKAKRLLGDPPRGHTILDIAFEVGFNSKATFNRAFKKQVQMTPREYQKSQGSQ